jgi:small GTP-binding protein
MISKKVILTGSFGVGKTSLFNQFIFNQFSDKYLTTIGVKVNKKVINIGGEDLSLLLWDIAGEVSQDKVPTSYFLGQVE